MPPSPTLSPGVRNQWFHPVVPISEDGWQHPHEDLDNPLVHPVTSILDVDPGVKQTLEEWLKE
jgi:hypothetical protein